MKKTLFSKEPARGPVYSKYYVRFLFILNLIFVPTSDIKLKWMSLISLFLIFSQRLTVLLTGLSAPSIEYKTCSVWVAYPLNGLE